MLVCTHSDPQSILLKLQELCQQLRQLLDVIGRINFGFQLLQHRAQRLQELWMLQGQEARQLGICMQPC